jgi:hypothetical protein
MDDAGQRKEAGNFFHEWMRQPEEEAGIFSQEWMMRPEEGGRQFSLRMDDGGRGRRQAIFSRIG